MRKMLPINLQRIRQQHSPSIEEIEKRIIDTHADFMMFFQSWIPLEEFKNLPIPTYFYILNRIIKSMEKPKSDVRWRSNHQKT